MTFPPSSARSASLALYVAAVVVSAALLFSVEPMVTRLALPRFGGSASVWSVAIVFFQATLLMGYLYAHVLAHGVSTRIGVIIHLAMMGWGLSFLPLRLAPVAAGGSEIVDLLIVFARSVGLPFLILSANAPLLQAWFARAGRAGAANPWPLYAASNVGSLGALLAYPLLVEPTLGLAAQGQVWTAGYLGLMGLIAAAGFWAGSGPVVKTAGMGRASLVELGRWVFFSAVPSAGLVAVTAHISTDVAAAPFLWVAPLALYLLTFIIVFAGRGPGRWSGAILAPTLVVLAVLVGFGLRLGLVVDIVVHLAGFFLLALACHARLAELRPQPERLTVFYLAMSLGGMVGGIFSALVAPRFFSFVAEYPLVLVAAAFALSRWRWPMAGLIGCLVVAGWLLPLDASKRETRRSFYGVHTIEETRDGQYRTLRHGREIHGAQRIRDAAGRALTGQPDPLTYYHEDGPISEAIDAARQKAGRPIRAGVVGLGTGSMACLFEKSEGQDFYEIDPEIVSIARDNKLFGFLSACGGDARVIEGDARLTLQASSARYDILIIDAFSSDAIPAHLLTREAMDVYMQRLAPGGLLVMHISNNHLRLNEIVAATATSLGLKVLIHDELEDEAAPRLVYQPTVAAIAREEADLAPLAAQEEWARPDLPPGVKPWTDDTSNLLGALLAKIRED